MLLPSTRVLPLSLDLPVLYHFPMFCFFVKFSDRPWLWEHVAWSSSEDALFPRWTTVQLSFYCCRHQMAFITGLLPKVQGQRGWLSGKCQVLLINPLCQSPTRLFSSDCAGGGGGVGRSPWFFLQTRAELEIEFCDWIPGQKQYLMFLWLSFTRAPASVVNDCMGENPLDWVLGMLRLSNDWVICHYSGFWVFILSKKGLTKKNPKLSSSPFSDFI